MQAPDKYRKISQMVFCNRVLKIHAIVQTKFSQVTVFNTKGADVAHEKNKLKISKCGEGWNSNLTQELNGQRGLSRDYNLVFSV